MNIKQREEELKGIEKMLDEDPEKPTESIKLVNVYDQQNFLYEIWAARAFARTLKSSVTCTGDQFNNRMTNISMLANLIYDNLEKATKEIEGF